MKRKKRNVIGVLLVLIIVMVLIVRLFELVSGSRPENLGLIHNQFHACPPKRNCVSSYSSSKQHYIAPLPYTVNAATSIQKINRILLELDGITIISKTINSLYAESKSRFLGFVDDIEIYCDSSEQQCFVRSAARLGHHDFGVNRQRIEKIRLILESKVN